MLRLLFAERFQPASCVFASYARSLRTLLAWSPRKEKRPRALFLCDALRPRPFRLSRALLSDYQDFILVSVLHFGHTTRSVPLPRGTESSCPHFLQRKYFVVLRLTHFFFARA